MRVLLPTRSPPRPPPRQIALDPATAAGATLADTADCAVLLPKGAACCQSAGNDASFPYELRLGDGATFVLAAAAVDAAAGTVSLAPVNASLAGPFSGVRYSWQSFPTCALKNSGSLPAVPFFAPLQAAPGFQRAPGPGRHWQEY